MIQRFDLHAISADKTDETQGRRQLGRVLQPPGRHAVRRPEEIGRRIGALYAINTGGAVAGTLCAAFVLLLERGLVRGLVLARGEPASGEEGR